MKNIHFLLVEDNEGDVLLTRLAFEESGIPFNLSVVQDGKEAIDFLNQEGNYQSVLQPELILLDINLPKKNGHEILQFIKQNETLKHIPVIMLTTSSSKMDIDLAYENGVGAFITKPSDVHEFFEAIASVIRFWFPTAHT